MATGTLISLEEYLQTSYRPDADFIDGEVLERNVGEKKHSKVQRRLIAKLAARADLHAFPELRLKVASRRYRVADLAVFQEEPEERYPSSPALIAIEVVSRDDRLSNIIERLDDYRNWGVPHIWLIDPNTRRFFTYGSGGLAETTSLRVAELDLTFNPSDVF